MTARTEVTLDRDIWPEPGTYGAMILQALREAESRDGIARLLHEQQTEVDSIVAAHRRAWDRFNRHNFRRHWFRPEMTLDILPYEITIVRRPHPDATREEVGEWLKRLEIGHRAVVCRCARQEWAELRQEKRRGKYVTNRA